MWNDEAKKKEASYIHFSETSYLIRHIVSEFEKAHGKNESIDFINYCKKNDFVKNAILYYETCNETLWDPMIQLTKSAEDYYVYIREYGKKQNRDVKLKQALLKIV